MKISKKELIARQAWTLEQKIDHTIGVIEQFYEANAGKVYIAFSGGKDSTVLLHLARILYPDVEAVFVDTGLEYPEVKKFISRIHPTTKVMKPKKNFKEVIDLYGYPVISKKISMGVSRYRNTKSDLQKELRLHGGLNPSSGKKQHATVTKKWHHLINAPFKISERCCDVLKKEPLRRFERETGKRPIIGTMCEESTLRTQDYLKNGCNAFKTKKPQSKPLSIWTTSDVWEFIRRYKVAYAEMYDKGVKRTGCMFCMFGVHMESPPNRFEAMKVSHPKQYKYCIEDLGLAEPLDYLNIDY